MDPQSTQQHATAAMAGRPGLHRLLSLHQQRNQAQQMSQIAGLMSQFRPPKPAPSPQLVGSQASQSHTPVRRALELSDSRHPPAPMVTQLQPRQQTNNSSGPVAITGRPEEVTPSSSTTQRGPGQSASDMAVDGSESWTPFDTACFPPQSQPTSFRPTGHRSWCRQCQSRQSRNLPPCPPHAKYIPTQTDQTSTGLPAPTPQPTSTPRRTTPNESDASDILSGHEPWVTDYTLPFPTQLHPSYVLPDGSPDPSMLTTLQALVSEMPGSRRWQGRLIMKANPVPLVLEGRRLIVEEGSAPGVVAVHDPVQNRLMVLPRWVETVRGIVDPAGIKPHRRVATAVPTAENPLPLQVVAQSSQPPQSPPPGPLRQARPTLTEAERVALGGGLSWTSALLDDEEEVAPPPPRPQGHSHPPRVPSCPPTTELSSRVRSPPPLQQTSDMQKPSEPLSSELKPKSRRLRLSTASPPSTEQMMRAISPQLLTSPPRQRIKGLPPPHSACMTLSGGWARLSRVQAVLPQASPLALPQGWSRERSARLVQAVVRGSGGASGNSEPRLLLQSALVRPLARRLPVELTQAVRALTRGVPHTERRQLWVRLVSSIGDLSRTQLPVVFASLRRVKEDWSKPERELKM